MCGIAGIISYNQGCTVNRQFLHNINQKMTARGPDESGFWFSKCGHVGLAHNRLSIIDPHERANEPMEYLSGRYVMTYNGEVYNYQELRKQLIDMGYRFDTQSDAEVVMAMYDRFGASMLEKLRGMFALAIWDHQEQKLFAARDPFGIKPFYFAAFEDEFVFSSQVSSIASETDKPLTTCSAGWCGFYLYGSVPEPFTTYEQIRALPAGHYIETDKSGHLTQQSYFSIYDFYREIEQSPASNPDLTKIYEALSESVNYHLVADVPVALFLSSGIDSNVIAALAKSNYDTDLHGFTLDFSDFNQSQNESELACLTAQRLKIKHHVSTISHQEAEGFLDQFLSVMDQPSIDGLNVWMISKVVSQAGYRAVLSGLGGDEILSGYASFTDVPKYARWLEYTNKANKMGLPLEKLSKIKLLSNHLHPKFSGFSSYSDHTFHQAYRLKRNLFLKQELAHFLDSNAIEQGMQQIETLENQTANQLMGIRNPYLKVSALEVDNYMKNQLLRDADWASMAHSLELRVPFVDKELIKVCAGELIKLKNPEKLTLMRTLMHERLPSEVLSREKTGFETPMKDWLLHNPSLQNWKKQSNLRADNTPWARRWAFEIGSRFLN